MHHIDHEQLMLCISHGYCTSLQRDRYSIYPIDIDIYNIDINIACTAGPPQGHGGGEAGYTTHPPATHKQTIPPPQPSTTGPQGGGGGVYPPYTMRGGGGWGSRPCTIHIYVYISRIGLTALTCRSCLEIQQLMAPKAKVKPKKVGKSLRGDKAEEQAEEERSEAEEFSAAPRRPS